MLRARYRGKKAGKALGRQRQTDLCEFKAAWSTRASTRTGSKATEKPCLEKPKRGGREGETEVSRCIVVYLQLQQVRDTADSGL